MTHSNKQAWVKVYNTWKGGRREVANVLVDLYEFNLANKFYRCFGYRALRNGTLVSIRYVSESDIVKVV